VSLKSSTLVRGISYAIILWVVGFVSGVIVFMVPLLKSEPSIPLVSKFPAVSLVLLPLYLVILWYLTPRLLASSQAKTVEGLKFGIVLVLVTLVLDIFVYVFLLGSGDYFTFLSIWVAYVMLILVPWLVGRHLQHAP
jgi:hypothetical protein